MHRRTTAALASAAALLVLTACGDTGGSDAHASGADPSTAAPSSTEAPEETSRIAPPDIDPQEFGGEAVDVFGRDMVDAGYAEAAAFTAETSFREELLSATIAAPTVEQLTGPTDWMTPSMAADYTDGIRRAVDGDAEAQKGVSSMHFFFAPTQGYEPQPSGPLLVNHVITGTDVSVSRTTGVDRLVVTLQQDADYRLLRNGAPVLSHLSKSATLWLVPAAPGSPHRWAVDGYQAGWESTDGVPDTGTY